MLLVARVPTVVRLRAGRIQRLPCYAFDPSAPAFCAAAFGRVLTTAPSSCDAVFLGRVLKGVQGGNQRTIETVASKAAAKVPSPWSGNCTSHMGVHDFMRMDAHSLPLPLSSNAGGWVAWGSSVTASTFKGG